MCKYVSNGKKITCDAAAGGGGGSIQSGGTKGEGKKEEYRGYTWEDTTSV